MPALNAMGAIFDRFAFPLHLQLGARAYALIALLVCGSFVVWLGAGSLRYMSPARRWIIVGLRMSVLSVLLLILCDPSWVRRSRDVEVIVLRDTSASTANAGTSMEPPQQSITQMVQSVKKRGADRIGVVSFADAAAVESLPGDNAREISHALPEPRDGTDIASAIRLSMACFGGDSMKRLVLVSDGNATQGDTLKALSEAVSMHIPVDVVPLHYSVLREVSIDRVIAPAWVRQNAPSSIEIVLQSTAAEPVRGNLTITENGLPIAARPAEQVTLRPGKNVLRVAVPGATGSGMLSFKAVFSPEYASQDQLLANNSAEAFTFVAGSQRVLFVDRDSSDVLLGALRSNGFDISDEDHIVPERFPNRLIDLEQYSAIVLANVPRGADGLNESQAKLIAHYVHDLGGGLVVIGGPEALGAGNWQGSELAKILPVDLDIPATRATPAGAMVMVLDASESMANPMPSGDMTKQQIANESAALALKTLQAGDYVGVIAFNQQASWVVPLSLNHSPDVSQRHVQSIASRGTTAIAPALAEAIDALSKIPPEQAPLRRIVLLTDGHSEPGDYDALLRRMKDAKITLSAVAVGPDADGVLLSDLATRGGGSAYTVDDPQQLRHIFVREARTLRRDLINEPAGGVSVAIGGPSEILKGLENVSLPPLAGMVLTSLKRDPQVHAGLVSGDSNRDPVLASWQCGLGRVAVFTGDATTRWASAWAASPVFGKFWSQTIQAISRPAMSREFDIQTARDGDTTRLAVEAINGDGHYIDFVNLAGNVLPPDGSGSQALRFIQTAPGRYEATIATTDRGIYTAGVVYQTPSGQRGTLLAGVVVPQSPEMHDLTSNDRFLTQIASQTGGRVFESPANAAMNLFDREGLWPSYSSQPLRDVLLGMLVTVFLCDVAARRVALDSKQIKHALLLCAAYVRSFTTIRKIEPRQTLDALKGIHARLLEQRQREDLYVPASPVFYSNAAGSVTATSGTAIGGLMEAKRRARQKIREKEQENQPPMRHR